MITAAASARQAQEHRNSARNLRERAAREENQERAQIQRTEADALEKEADKLAPPSAKK